MTTAVVTVLQTFMLTGLIGNWLVQRWQHRNWLNQQRFLGAEKEYNALKELFEEISSLLGKRLSRMNRLLRVVNSSDKELLQSRLKDYDEAVAEWNGKLNAFFVRITMYDRFYRTERLENEVHASLVRSGSRLERLVSRSLSHEAVSAKEITELSDRLNTLQGQIFSFNRDFLRAVQAKQQRTYYGVWIEFTRQNLEEFPTWKLFKLLFVPRIELLGIVRPPTDLGEPFRGNR